MDKNISFQDLLTKLSEIEASSFKLRPIKTILEDTECFEIFSVILSQEPPIVHVVDLKRISGGFITLRDLLGLFIPKHVDIHSAFSRSQMLSNSRAGDLAKTHLPYVYDDTKLKEIAELMLKFETDFLPRSISKKESELQGIILQRDLISECREIRLKFNVVRNGENNG
ncbi:MAG: CBS domain-containing protein [Candidatus Heimdallarchaeota archaeon]|nr:CBS domain-containing protein [Candidatus Heimdallarchaeota archaeon]